MAKLFCWFVAICSILLPGCGSSSLLNVSNQSAHTLVFRFEAPFRDDTAAYFIPSGQARVVQSAALTEAGRDDDLTLRSILVRIDSSDQYTVLRFSRSYLEMAGWNLQIPIIIPPGLQYKPLEVDEKVRAFYNHSFYHLVQALYNGRKYADCLNAVKDISSLLVLESQDLAKNSQRGDLGWRTYIAEKDGYMLLGYFSALKTRNLMLADAYWKTVRADNPVLADFLKKHDYEVMHQNVE